MSYPITYGYVMSVLMILPSLVQAKPTQEQAQRITAQPFVKVKLKKHQLQLLCKNFQLICNEESGALWQNKRAEADYYLIDKSPKLVKLRKRGSEYIAVDQWDFSKYQHHSTGPITHDMGENGVSIYPALYPLNQTQVSVAVLQNYFTGFSGGGANESIADFVMLQSKGRYKVALKNISFDESHMYRACFSSEEYKSSLHCHDEGWRVLRIKFKDIGAPYYQWTLNYTDTFWEAHKPENSQTKTYERAVKMPFKD